MGMKGSGRFTAKPKIIGIMYLFYLERSSALVEVFWEEEQHSVVNSDWTASAKLH